MVVGEAIGLGRVLGVLEVILHLAFRFGSLMHELSEVVVGLEVDNLLGGMIESIQETCHCLLIIFLDIGSNHGYLHFLVVFFNTLCSLLEQLELLEEIAVVVGGHKTCSHDIFHLSPSGDWWFTSCFSALKDLFPPYEHIVLEFKGCHSDLLLFLIVVQMKDVVDLPCP